MTRRSETCRPAMLGTLGILGVNVEARERPGQRIVGHCELSDNRLEVEYGSRRRSKQTQGSVVGLVPDSEARAVPRRSRGNRESSIRLWMVDYSSEWWSMRKVFSSSNGESHTAVNILSVWIRPTVRQTPHRQSRYHRLSASSQNILQVSWMVRRQSARGSGFQEKYRSLSEDRCRFGCAAPRPTACFR